MKSCVCEQLGLCDSQHVRENGATKLLLQRLHVFKMLSHMKASDWFLLRKNTRENNLNEFRITNNYWIIIKFICSIYKTILKDILVIESIPLSVYLFEILFFSLLGYSGHKSVNPSNAEAI